jgi:ribosome maturation factor RimP
MSVTAERIGDLIVPLLSELGLGLYDLEYTGGHLRVLVDRDGGVDLGSITDATRRISLALDEADLISSAYTLEVSSPGLERTLRTPEHYAGAVGELVKLKTRPNTDGDRRVEGRLVASDVHTVTVRGDDDVDHIVSLADIDRARTHFIGDAAPKPGSGSRPGKGPKAAKGAAAKAAKSKGAPGTTPAAPPADPDPSEDGDPS